MTSILDIINNKYLFISNKYLVFDKNNNIIYLPKYNSTNKAQIVKLKDNRYVVIKPLKNKFIKLNKILESFSHTGLREHIFCATIVPFTS